MICTLFSKQTDGDGPAQRESWMLELPPEFSKNFGKFTKNYTQTVLLLLMEKVLCFGSLLWNNITHFSIP